MKNCWMTHQAAWRALFLIDLLSYLNPFFSDAIDMPNLSTYYAPPIHLRRELPKKPCALIQHELDYVHFLRTRVAGIQSSLSSTNRRKSKDDKELVRRRYVDHNQRLYHVHRRNLQLCRKILNVWNDYEHQRGGVDCHNENHKKPSDISHLRLRQTRWKDRIEKENQRFIHSLV